LAPVAAALSSDKMVLVTTPGLIMRLFRVLFFCLVAGVPLLAAAQQGQGSEDEPQGVVDAFKKGTALLSLRYRYEYVGDDAIEKNAHASTLRTALSYRTAPWRGFEFFIEAENVAELGDDRYRDAGRGRRGNGVTDRPVVADPTGTDLNQVMLRYRGFGTDVRIGRQEISIDDERFVGPVGWRQHHQTFSAVNVANSSLGRLTLQYVFSNEVYRIFGDSLATANHFVHGSIDAGSAGTVKIYAYLLDFTEEAGSALSTNSFGFELTGAQDLGDAGRVLYEAEYARQLDAADNPNRIRATYAHLMAGVGFEQLITARIGWELLGGSPAEGKFSTPLATVHKFNGWADKFLSTPTNGLRDLYVSLSGSLGVFGWLATYHEFTADTGRACYGSEFDGQITYRSPWQQQFALKGAYYGADEFSTDTLKLWFYTTYAF